MIFRQLHAVGLAFAFAAAAHAADRPLLLQAGDKENGEDEAIHRRIEWFEQTRRLDENPQARLQRAHAVTQLRDQVARGLPALLAAENW